jgi:hypothetical protein
MLAASLGLLNTRDELIRGQKLVIHENYIHNYYVSNSSTFLKLSSEREYGTKGSKYSLFLGQRQHNVLLGDPGRVAVWRIDRCGDFMS